MTDFGPPPNPPGPWGGPPHGGAPYGGPPYGGGGPYGGPQTAPRPAASLAPIIVVTVLFALFGLIPTVMASNKASERRESASRYWVAFGVSLFASFVLYAVVVIVLVFVVLAGAVTVVGAAANAVPSIGQQDPTFPGATPSASSTGPVTCTYTPDGTTAAASLPDADPGAATTRTWTLVTSAGTIVVELDAAAAPCTVNSIVHLTETGFYDGTPCPRSVDQGLSILQCGDPTGTGAGGPGYTFADEGLGDADYTAGAVAMANRGPDTNGSQFFLMDEDQNGALPKSYTVFGRVTSGLDVLTAIVAAGNDGSNGAGDGKPTPAVTIRTATIS